ncbi:MAG: hypothetical protein EXR58_06860 [Chloroflexi bacterium]|nr:hypothetical protein [Chloroflexota bacterium]
MIFADFYGTAWLFGAAQSALREGIAGVFRARLEDVVVRRIVVEGEYTATEVWIELSSDEQLMRHGQELARVISAVVQAQAPGEVWVLFRIVPLSHVYLNGEPRRRGSVTLE